MRPLDASRGKLCLTLRGARARQFRACHVCCVPAVASFASDMPAATAWGLVPAVDVACATAMREAMSMALASAFGGHADAYGRARSCARVRVRSRLRDCACACGHALARARAFARGLGLGVGVATAMARAHARMRARVPAAAGAHARRRARKHVSSRFFLDFPPSMWAQKGGQFLSQNLGRKK